VTTVFHAGYHPTFHSSICEKDEHASPSDRNQQQIQIRNQVQANTEPQRLRLLAKLYVNYKQKGNSRGMESCEELFKINKEQST